MTIMDYFLEVRRSLLGIIVSQKTTNFRWKGRNFIQESWGILSKLEEVIVNTRIWVLRIEYHTRLCYLSKLICLIYCNIIMINNR
jgi:hypothetical protein